MSPYDQPEYRSFVREICSAPEDDTPRLVVADWLEERGEAARAEFIRVQVELAKMPPKPRQLFEADGAGTRMEGLGVALIPMGAGHYSVSSRNRGLSTETFSAGERVDIYAHLARGDRIGWMRGLKYVKHIPERHEIIFRKDDKSGPWAGEALAKRERELWTSNCRAWVANTFGLDAEALSGRAACDVYGSPGEPGLMSFVPVRRGFVEYRRGFPTAFEMSAADWIANADRLYWHPGQTVACGGRPVWDQQKWQCTKCGEFGSYVMDEGEIHRCTNRVPRPFPTDSGQTVKCTRCDGDGRIGGVSSDDTYDCSSCNGTGEVVTPAVLPHPITEVTLTTRPTGESWYGVNLVNATKCEHTRWPGIKFNLTPAPIGAAAGSS